MCQIGLDDCQRHPGLYVLYLRRIAKAGSEALDQLRQKTIMRVPHTYNRQSGLIKFPNQSRIQVGNFKDEKDIEKHQGLEYDVIALEERTQLTDGKIQQLLGSLRTSKPDWRPRTYSAANPGGIGHDAFRRTFWVPYKTKTETNTRYIPTSWRYNPYLDPDYRLYLEGLRGVLRRLWTDGDWDITAGNYFIKYDKAVHTIPELPLIPVHWPITWVSMDWGYHHPGVIQWHTETPQGTVITFDEITFRNSLVDKVAEQIHAVNRRWSLDHRITVYKAGHDIFSRRGDSATTIAQQFHTRDIPWTPARVDRIAGAQQIAARLGDPIEGHPASWRITYNCERLIETMPMLQIDPRKREDVMKWDANEHGVGGDDSYDAARYGLMERPIHQGNTTISQRY